MKFLPIFTLFSLSLLKADPQLSSWYLDGSRSYAQIFQTDADVQADPQVTYTEWSNPNSGTGQVEKTYAGVHEVSYDTDSIYVRSSGLGSHRMGPWYQNGATRTNLFINWPASRDFYFEVPRTPLIPTVANKTDTGLGVIGIFVDGVSMFDSRDGNSYDNLNIWNQDAYVNESQTFDAAFAHQAGVNYHYHANPPGLRYQLGDSVDYDAATNTYTENFNGQHSPILGWVADGLPIYGPYGYSDPLDPTSEVTRMRSGFEMRPITVRETLPEWAVRYLDSQADTILDASEYGPAVDAANPVGIYLEDYQYLGDQGLTLVNDFDLNEYNTRFCITPEYPNGTWAYFVSIEADGTPKFPYNIGRQYYGNPNNGGTLNALPNNRTVYAEGGPESPIDDLAITTSNDDVILTWSGVDGATYQISTSHDLDPMVPAQKVTTDTFTEVQVIANEPRTFYSVEIVSVAPYDETGFESSVTEVDESLQFILITLTGTTPSDLSINPNILTFNGEPVQFVSRPSANEILIAVDTSALTVGSYPVSVQFSGQETAVTGSYEVFNNSNILFIIVDDWGIDSSPVDNPDTSVAADVPDMPFLESLMSSSIRFSNGYVEPMCSTTRAATMTGLHPSLNGVGSPAGVDLADALTTLPEALTANTAYSVGAVGKWHLGGGTTGPIDDGWEYFSGALSNLNGTSLAGTDETYTNWVKTTDSTTTTVTQVDETGYAITVNTDEAINWIGTNGTDPWLCWVAYNAPHSPFEDPPTIFDNNGNALTNPYVGGGTNRSRFKAMLWAMDAEIERLLANVDLDQTTVVIMGDNGTPGQVGTDMFSAGHWKTSLYEGGVHVPFIIRPAGGTTSRVEPTLVHCVDLFPTFLEIAGVDPTTYPVSGQSLVPLINNYDTAESRFIISEQFGTSVASPGKTIRIGDYKLHQYDDLAASPNNSLEELYYLVTDPDELTDLLLGTLTATEQSAYDELTSQLLAQIPNITTNYMEFPTVEGANNYPALTRTRANGVVVDVEPIGLTVGGVAATYVDRVDATDTDSQYWIKFEFNEGASGLSAGSYDVVVTYSGATDDRVYTALTQYIID